MPTKTLPSRYMKVEEVAEQLGFKSRGPVYSHIDSGELIAVNVSPAGVRPATRVTRASFEAYCARIEGQNTKLGQAS